MKERYKKSHETKCKQLGVHASTARYQLIRVILLHYIRECGEDKCYRCGVPIEDPNDLSIDHKIPWLHNGKELFYDIGNIAWSHKKCNKADRTGRKQSKEGYSWCCVCKKELPLEEFSKKATRWNGVDFDCKSCKSIRAKEFQPKRKDRNKIK